MMTKDNLIVLIKDMLHRYQEHQIRHISGSLAYFFTLAIFPLFIFIQALLGLFDVGLTGLLENIESFSPQNVHDLLLLYIQSISGQRIGLLSFGLISALYAASIAVNSIMNAVLLAYGQKSKHSWYVNKAMALFFTIMIGISMSLFLIVPVLGSLVYPFLSDLLPNMTGLFDIVTISSWVISTTAIAGTLALLYKIVPETGDDPTIWPGTIFALLGWLLGSTGFAYYVNHFANYSTYGVFGSIMVFLLWLYITGMMIILGAELNDALDQIKSNHS